jgi:hypothetical protein
MLTASVQSSRLCRPVHDRHKTFLDRTMLSPTPSLGSNPSMHHHRTTHWRIGGQRRRAPNTHGVNNHPAARETTNPRYHGLHLLRHICLEISTVHASSPTAPSVPFRPLSVAPKISKQRRSTAFCVATHAEGLPHLGKGLPVMSARQNLPPHSHFIGRIYTAGSPFSSRPRRSRGVHSNISGLHIHSAPLQPTVSPAGQKSSHPGHHSRHRGTPPT